MTERRTQAERRAETRMAVLESACRLFGRKGYAATSLEEIASEAGMTIRPIYHYFGSKLDLFEAVNEVMEERIIASLQNENLPEAREHGPWHKFLDLCQDPEFRRVVLVDGPNVLGRERWATSDVQRAVVARFGSTAPGKGFEENRLSDLAVRMMIGALTEAALTIAESDDPTQASREAETLVAALVPALASSK